MAKELFSLKAECVSANKTRVGSTIQFAVGIKTDGQNTTARAAITIQDPDNKGADKYQIGKVYTITITE